MGRTVRIIHPSQVLPSPFLPFLLPFPLLLFLSLFDFCLWKISNIHKYRMSVIFLFPSFTICQHFTNLPSALFFSLFLSPLRSPSCWNVFKQIPGNMSFQVSVLQCASLSDEDISILASTTSLSHLIQFIISLWYYPIRIHIYLTQKCVLQLVCSVRDPVKACTWRLCLFTLFFCSSALSFSSCRWVVRETRSFVP